MKKLLLSLLMLCGMAAAWAGTGDDFVNVASASQMYNVLSGNARAKVRLTADIYLSDLGADFGDTFCSTFYGILDGDGHAIKGDHYDDNTTQRRNRCYLFTYSDSATFRNLTFKHIRKNSEDHHNQAIITSQAKNGCVFENITFENCGTWTNYDNAGSAAGWAENCNFTNITVKNSDFTVDHNQSGCVVGHAIGCTFTNIKVENCESTAAAQTYVSIRNHGKAGGVVGRSDDCTFENVEVHGSFIKTYIVCGGGIAGFSTNSQFTNCTIDDQSCVCVKGDDESDCRGSAGGIVGYSENGRFYSCINSALIACDYYMAGGIVGYSGQNGIFEGCLNTGMVISEYMDAVIDGLYNKYKTKTDMTCVTKTYQGKEYVIRQCDSGNYRWKQFGGIIGYMETGNVSKCVNFGTVKTKGLEAVSSKDNNGGIVGYLANGTISDCLSDFSACDKVHGICGYVSGKSSINNCLNMTTYKDFAALDDDWTGFKSNDKNYSLTTAEDAPHAKKTTAAKIKSGEICHLLGENWEQNVGTDAYPTPSGDKGVYHTRTVSNQYGTVCLPFVVQSDDKISYYSLSRKEEDGQGIKLVFTYNEDSILEGTPLLFRSAEAKDADADNPVEICFNNAGEEFTTTPRNKTFDAGFWDLWGTFEQRVFEGDLAKNIYYVSGGEIRNAKKTTIAPYRAWIYGEDIDNLTGNGAQAKAIQLVLAGENGETTLELVGEDLVPVQQGAKSYSLMGTEVGDGYRGLVIRNGKKVIQNR